MSREKECGIKVRNIFTFLFLHILITGMDKMHVASNTSRITFWMNESFFKVTASDYCKIASKSSSALNRIESVQGNPVSS